MLIGKVKTIMDLEESAQEFRNLAARSTCQAVSDNEDEIIFIHSDSDEDDRSSKQLKTGNFKDAWDFLDKDNQLETIWKLSEKSFDKDFPDKIRSGTVAFDELSNNTKSLPTELPNDEVKVDEENENVLEDIIDSPRSSEGESIHSNRMDKDSNDDAMKLQSVFLSSAENSNSNDSIGASGENSSNVAEKSTEESQFINADETYDGAEIELIDGVDSKVFVTDHIVEIDQLEKLNDTEDLIHYNDPPPRKPLCPTAFSLYFVRKFRKNFDKMNRNDLEELLIKKCVEAIVHKSDRSDMRNRIEIQDNKLHSYHTKYQELRKQYRDLEIIHQRVVKDLEDKNKRIVMPMKITRAVGLQVCVPRKEIAVPKSPTPLPTTPSTTAENNADVNRNRRKVALQSPNDPNKHLQQQEQQTQNSSSTTPDSAEQLRIPPVILKKMENEGRTIYVISPNSTTANVYTNQTKLENTTIVRSSVTATATTTTINNIDLTDDDEDSKQANVATNDTNPPALVAIPLSIAPKNNNVTQQIVYVQPARTITVLQRCQHPAPLPFSNNQPSNSFWKYIPPRPSIIRINKIESGIVISWTMDEMTDKHAEVIIYQIFAYRETSAAPSPETWRYVGDVKAMLLPMAVTLTQHQQRQRYHFAVRAVDEYFRYGTFSLPKTWT